MVIIFKHACFLLLIALFLTACGAKSTHDRSQENDVDANMTFSDESDSWKGALNAVLKGGKEKMKLTLTYTKDDYDSIYNVGYNVEGPEENVAVDDETLHEHKTLRHTEEYNESVYTHNEDATYDVTIEWQDQSEALTLEKE